MGEVLEFKPKAKRILRKEVTMATNAGGWQIHMELTEGIKEKSAKADKLKEAYKATTDKPRKGQKLKLAGAVIGTVLAVYDNRYTLDPVFFAKEERSTRLHVKLEPGTTIAEVATLIQGNRRVPITGMKLKRGGVLLATITHATPLGYGNIKIEDQSGVDVVQAEIDALPKYGKKRK